MPQGAVPRCIPASVIVTYANVNTDLGQGVSVVLLSGATTCSQFFDPTTGTGFIYVGGTDGNLGPSPATITVGASGIVIPIIVGSPEPVFAPLTAGNYLACLYYTDVESESVEVQQSFPISIHLPIEPVVPSFTG